MTTPTTTTTVTANLMAKIKASDDEDELKLLLGLFADVPAAELPIVELTHFLLTTDTDGHLWLVTATMTDVWDKASELVSEDADRIPAEPVIAALRHALDVLDEDDEEADADLDECLTQIVGFANVLRPFPADILAELLAHRRGFVRILGLDVLYQLDREPEILPLLQDPDWEVRQQAIKYVWNVMPLTTLQAMAQGDAEETVRTTAAQMISYAQQQGQRQPQPTPSV
ncbi:MAG: HEAT repeat domain-containing protein [Ktedonobacterales bacterium]|nr:HEAT repeat domain-containing protein [Ktedonobacterales bacterium]